MGPPDRNAHGGAGHPAAAASQRSSVRRQEDRSAARKRNHCVYLGSLARGAPHRAPALCGADPYDRIRQLGQQLIEYKGWTHAYWAQEAAHVQERGR
jgi:hypothetical protein